MLFSLRRVTHFPSLTFNNTSIEFVDSHKHLGVTLSDNGQWHTNIESILASAYKILGIMRKLKYTFSRTALNQIFISYIRPVLEYSAVVWDGCTIQDKLALEKLQNEAARIVTGLTRSASLDNLYRECGWVSLSERRKFQKLCFMYKCNNGQIPRYISDLIPPLVSEIFNYSLRNRANLSSVRTRTETFKMSCIPSSVLLWNSLSDDIKYAPSLVTFQNSLRNQMLNIPSVPAYFLQGNRKLSILHARLRNNCSDLNGDLYLNHSRNDSICACGNSNESSLHFLLECERFSNQRILMFRETRPFHPLSVNYLLFGKPNLSNDKPSFSGCPQVYKKYKEVCIDNHTQRCIRYESRMVVRNPYSIAAHFLSFYPSFLSLVFLFFFFFFSFFVCIFVTYTFFVHAQRAKSGLHAGALQNLHRH